MPKIEILLIIAYKRTNLRFKKKSWVAEIPPRYVPFICWSGGSQKPSMCLLRRSINSTIEATDDSPYAVYW